jgi:hypothetical protein
MSSPAPGGSFIGKIDRETRYLRGYSIAFMIYAMEYPLRKSSVLFSYEKVQSLIVGSITLTICREFLDTEVPLIINWWMSHEFKQEFFVS